MDEIKKIAGEITGIHVEPIDLDESFVDFSARFAAMAGTTVLLSGGDLDCARYHILGAKPWLTFRGRNRKMTITSADQTVEVNADPFDTLRSIINAFHLNDLDLDPSGWPQPLAAGLFGYLSYDLKDVLEKLPRTSVDDLRLPHICFLRLRLSLCTTKALTAPGSAFPSATLPGKAAWMMI